MDTNSHKEHRRSKTDSLMSYSFGSMSQDFLGSRNVLGGTFDDLDEIDNRIEHNERDDLEPTLVGNKHLRSMSFMDSRDVDADNDSDIFIMNAHGNGPSELDSNVAPHMGQMSPPLGVSYRQKKAIRSSRPMSSATSATRGGGGGGGHRRIKSMSSASADQMMLDCFRRDPNVALHELPDLGSMSMESMKFTSEDWQEAFIQIGAEHDLLGSAGGSVEMPSGSNTGQRKAMDTSTFGISLPPSYSPSKANGHMPPPPMPRSSPGSKGGGGAVLQPDLQLNLQQQHMHDAGSSSRSHSEDSNSSVFREFQQRQQAALRGSSPPSDVSMQEGYSDFMHLQAQQYTNSAPAADFTDSTSNNGAKFQFALPTSIAAVSMNMNKNDAKKMQSYGHSGNGVNQIQAGGISEPEYHKSKGAAVTDDLLDMEKKSSNRGKYRCGRCGLPKVNHQCPYEIETSTRSISSQVSREVYDAASHPFLTEKTITVRRPGTPDKIVEGGDSSGSMTVVGVDSSDQNQRMSVMMMDPSLTDGEGVVRGGQAFTHEQQIQSQMQHVNSPTSSSVYMTDEFHHPSQPPLSNSRSPGTGILRKTHLASQSNVNVKQSPSTTQGNKAPSPLPANFTRSTSSDTSMYNEILKDLRIVHPSMIGKQPLQKPVMVKPEEQQALATVSTDESDSNHSLFLSSLSSNSSSND